MACIGDTLTQNLEHAYRHHHRVKIHYFSAMFTLTY